MEAEVWSKDVPWEGIGAKIIDGVNEDFMQRAGLAWDIERRPLFSRKRDGEMIECPDRYAMIRSSDEKYLTTTGKAWSPVQPRDVVKFVAEYAAAGGATIEAAGSLRDGKMVWALAKLDNSFEVGRGDKVGGNLLFLSPNVVGKATTVRTVAMRFICSNQLPLFENSEKGVQYKQSHLNAFDIERARETVALANDHVTIASKRAATLHRLKLNIEDAITKVIAPTFAPEIERAEGPEFAPSRLLQVASEHPRIQAIVDAINNGPGATPGTGWGVLNGITYWADHVNGRNNASRLFRSWAGDIAMKKVEAEKRLFELA
jgi:phage/plasmid-like protein (TIGR03299 family)